CAIERHRIALEPLLELLFRTVFRRVGARVPAVSVGEAFDEGGAAARARLGEGVARSAVYDVGVVAVDDLALQAVAGGAVGGRVFHRGDGGNRRVLHVHVVLAAEDDRELPHRGEVEGFVESADVGRAIAEEGTGDLFRSAILRRPRGAGGDRQMRADDGIRAEEL